MRKLELYNIDGNVLLSPKKRVRLWVKHKRMDLYVQRVESSLYKRMGWDNMHYLDYEGAKFNKSHHSLIFTDSKGRCIAYVAYANHTFRRCKNGIMISRYIISPKFQHKGLSIKILNLVGAMLTASGYVLYFNTELKWFGKKVGESDCWDGTINDARFREAPSDTRNKNRRSGVAYRKKYVGKPLMGYSNLFLKVGVLRSRMARVNASMKCVEKTFMSDSNPFLENGLFHSRTANATVSSGVVNTGFDGSYNTLEKSMIPIVFIEGIEENIRYMIEYEDSS